MGTDDQQHPSDWLENTASKPPKAVREEEILRRYRLVVHLLTPKQWEVAQLHAKGVPNCEIARRLGKRASTISGLKRAALRVLERAEERELRTRLRLLRETDLPDSDDEYGRAD